MSLLCIRISHVSHVSVPSPSGLFLHGTLRCLWGAVWGRSSGCPYAPLSSLSDYKHPRFFASVPVRDTLAFCDMSSSLPRLYVYAYSSCNCLTHISYGESSHFRYFLCFLYYHGSCGPYFDYCCIPVFRKSGFSSFTSPVLGSIFLISSSNLHATCAVYAWKTGV